ncbi:hypothetical protein D5R40_10985 [Okeania hirsuta]|uniref:Uncharacterized protein n=1 Tax=Okeania hirsuta TaxID=1458930 RepID=A0A3N6PCC4_9CYAN|nr:hypothetical protein D4Z78_05445 [Okeania hirsuta]RQH45197.1 hypothetical protein D5R40_10985 [Okeania hirsuta]
MTFYSTKKSETDFYLLSKMPPDQKIRSQASPFNGMKKNQVQYFNSDAFLWNAPQTGRGTDN